MNNFLLYILDSSLSLGLLYLLFRIALRNETLFKINRYTLLVIVLSSLIIPVLYSPLKTNNPISIPMSPSRDSGTLIHIDYSGLKETENKKQNYIQQLITWDQLSKISQILFYGYLLGCLIAFLILIFGFIRIGSLFTKAQFIKRDKFRLLLVEQEISAFSFGFWVFISKNDYEHHGFTILTHEEEHIRLRHFYDLIILETVKIIYWFNPAIYWLIRDMKDIHEFQADNYTLSKGIDATQYQLLIIQKGVGSQRFALANSFNQFQIKKRITMMNKQKSSKTTVWKMAAFLPLFALLLMAFGRNVPNPQALNSIVEKSEQKLNEGILPQVKESKVIDNHLSSVEGINYTADDKIVLDTHSSKILLYKNAQVSYKNVKISADFIELDRKENILFAKGNSLFKKEDKEIKAYEIKYNLTNGKTAIKDKKNGKNIELSQNLPQIEEVNSIYNKCDEMPQYPGGMEEMMKFIMGNIKYTDLAKKDWAEGRVMVNFIINKNGKIEKARIAHGVHPDLDAEALRVIGLLPTWKPGKQNGKAVDVFYTIPIQFVLDPSVKKSISQTAPFSTWNIGHSTKIDLEKP